ncbi:MAG: flavin reductase family protein, partial [Gaiellaceae bacterium]
MPAEIDAAAADRSSLVSIPIDAPIWDRVFVVAPLVLVATKEDGGYDIAPKHLAMPCGWDNYFAFICTPRHSTYRNIRDHPEFTVSFPRPDRILDASLAAGERFDDRSKPTLAALPTFVATAVDGVLVENCALYLECSLERIVDDLGGASLVVGRIVAASAPRALLRRPGVDDADLLYEQRPLVYLAPARFGFVRETYSF